MSHPMKRSFSSEGGATSRRDWKMRLSLRSRSGRSADPPRGRRCASLRSAATAGRDDSGRSTPSAAARASPSPADTPAPKKSNWEVIEHFSSSRSKKSPTAAYIIKGVTWTRGERSTSGIKAQIKQRLELSLTGLCGQRPPPLATKSLSYHFKDQSGTSWNDFNHNKIFIPACTPLC
ncbi:hypothetical protein RR46_04404 [Papilio xuthus]|uniref:Uncharacterized protein n=1 Tax=Papilio xuthus TaxID=66420 RepID=A0A194PLM3_PAPXU|nr:hypothetical protein RR46_04404 [Papilio xuthus]